MPEFSYSVVSFKGHYNFIQNTSSFRPPTFPCHTFIINDEIKKNASGGNDFLFDQVCAFSFAVGWSVGGLCWRCNAQ